MYKICQSILVSAFLVGFIATVGCPGGKTLEEAAKKNNFIEIKDDKEEVPLDKANRLVGKWVTRIALRSGTDVLLGTAEFNLAEQGGELFFADFTWQKIIQPEVKDDKFSGKLSGVTSKELLNTTTKATITAGPKEGTNYLKIFKGSGLVKRLIEFSIDFRKDPMVATIAKEVTNGLMWISRDAKTMIGTNGVDLNFIAQRDTTIKDISLSDIAGGWETIGYKLYPRTKAIVADSSLTSLDVKASSSELETTFSGQDEHGKSFTGNIYLVDKTMGGSLIDLTAGGSTQSGGILLSPDGNYVYGVFFPATTYSLGDDQFIGVKK